jgi:hypothetical protein
MNVPVLVKASTVMSDAAACRVFWWLMLDVGADELHAFAQRLGLQRSWSQERPKAIAHHYDIVPTKRALALRLGAVEVSSRELCIRNYDGFTQRRARGELPERSLPVVRYPP